MEDQIDTQTDNFGKFFTSYDGNQHAVTIPRRNTHLPFGNTTRPSFDVSHNTLNIGDQVDGQTKSFGEFLADYDDNQHIITTPYHDTHLPSGNRTGPSSDKLHTLSKDDLFRELSNSDLQKFTCQEPRKLFDTESIQQFDARPNI